MKNNLIKILLTLAVLIQIVRSQLVNIIKPSMVVTSDAVISGSFTPDKLNDGLFSTHFVQNANNARYVQVDLGAVFEVKSLLLTQYITTDNCPIDVYIGAFSDSAYKTNTRCC